MIFDAPAVVPALLTPFDAAGEVDRAALREHVEFVIEGGVDGLMPCGTTGETALLEADEVIAVVTTVVEHLQEEIADLERRLTSGPALVSLKTDVAEAMAARGSRYPAALRSPLGT